MSEETNNPAEEAENPQPMSPEEISQMRERMNQYYDEELPMLRKQEEFERLQADIEEHKVRRMTMMIRSAQLYAQAEMAEQEAQNPDPSGDPEGNDPANQEVKKGEHQAPPKGQKRPTKRTLKKS